MADFLIEKHEKPIRISLHKNDIRIGFSIRFSNRSCIVLHNSIFILLFIVFLY